MNEANKSFAARAFHPSLGNEVAAGRLTMDRWHFHFRSETLTLDVPLHRLRARLGEGNDERIYFQDAQSPEWEVNTDDFSILDHPFLPQAQTLYQELSQTATRQELTRRMRMVGYTFGIILLLIWLGNLGVKAMVWSLVTHVPPELEKSFGAAALAEVQAEMTFIDDTNRVAQLALLAGPLTNATGLGTNGLTFYIAEDESPNAFAMPGGHVVVTTGLLKLVERPEALLGVISHEIAHVTRKHSLRQVISSAGPFLVLRVFLGSRRGMGGMLASASDLLVRQGFSREYEIEADDVGWEIMVASGVNPQGMTTALTKLKAHEDREAKHDAVDRAFSSHPALEKRLARLDKKWKKRRVKSGFLDLSGGDATLRSLAGK